jgi:hypothetical protein
VSLAEARALFARVDQDASGELGTREADYAGLAASTAASFDADGNGSLSLEEFIVAHQQTLVRAGKRAAPDLEAESTRIQAVRRAKQAERVRAAQGPSELRTKAGEAKQQLDERLRQADVDRRMKAKAKAELDERIRNAVGTTPPTSESGPARSEPTRERARDQRPMSPPTDTERRAAEELIRRRLEQRAPVRPEVNRPNPRPPSSDRSEERSSPPR